MNSWQSFFKQLNNNIINSTSIFQMFYKAETIVIIYIADIL